MAIVTGDGHQSVGVVVRRDPIRDLALVLTETPLAAIQLAPAEEQRQGDSVLIFGYPRPDVLSGQATLTRGLISALRQDPTNDRLLVQTDAAVNPGNSGGPIVNMDGKLVGLVTFQVTASEGLGFGVATESIQTFLATPLETPTVTITPQPTSAPAEAATPMPTFAPAPAVVRFTVDARDVVIHLSDFPRGWSAVDTPGTSNSPVFASSTFKAPDGFGLIGSDVLIASNQSIALGAAKNTAKDNDINEVRVVAQKGCDRSDAWMTSPNPGYTSVDAQCVIGNALLEVRMFGPSDKVDAGVANGWIAFMASRLRRLSQ